MQFTKPTFYRQLINDPDLLLQAVSVFVITASVLLTLPALLIPLGLPPEGDAVDYRIPMIRWMLHHGSFPNWPWTMIDDYPALGELLMTPFYYLSPALARLVPISAYIGLGVVGGALATRIGVGQSDLNKKSLFLLGVAWTLSLRPLAIQANLLMVDNLASFFLLGSFVLLLRRSLVLAAMFAALSMATRYTAWGSAAFLPLIVLAVFPSERRWRSLLLFCGIAALGPLPFMIRNYFVNDGHPFFPVDAPEVMRSMGMDGFGTGVSLLSFLRLPYDLLYTNTFGKSVFDYSIGRVFYLQLVAVIFCFIRCPWKPRWPGLPAFLTIAFGSFHLLVWFFSGQQLRFLVPSLIVINIGMLLAISDRKYLVAFVTVVGAVTAISVQKDSVLMAIGRKSLFRQEAVAAASDCFRRAEVYRGPVGYLDREGVLGFFEHDFYFIGRHPYAISQSSPVSPSWIYTLEQKEGYAPWPRESPCLLKREEARK